MAIKKDYTIETEDNSYGDITELDWYKESKERLHKGGIIRVLRNNKNLSQGELGKQLGITSKYVSDLEHGRRAISLKIAKKLAGFFNRNIERFLPLQNDFPGFRDAKDG